MRQLYDKILKRGIEKMPVEIKNIQKSFGEKQVLRGFNLTLEDDNIYCLMGPSGMGKTTLLRIIMGREQADDGTISGIKNGEISAMFQEDRLCMTLSAVENVALVTNSKESRKTLATELTDILPENCLNQPMMQLSGGMKRRVALARAMHYPSKMVILDEPFTGLDRETKMEVIDYLLQMRRGRIMLIATHGVDDAALLGAKVIRLDEINSVPEQEEKYEDIVLFKEEIFRNMKMFKGIPESNYDAIIRKLGGYEMDYNENDIVWEQFENRTVMGIVLKGCIQAEYMSHREPQIIQQFNAGNSFGEAIAFGGQNSWVEIRAVKKTKVLFLPAANFFANKNDADIVQIIANLLREMSNKIAILNMKNQLLSEPRLRNRILMYLNTLPANEKGYKEVPFNQKDFAQYLNVNYSAFCREISHMRDDGILETKERMFRVKLDDQAG